MSFSKNDLDAIKSKIKISDELQKKVNVIKKGNDHWCCCPFHDEKTPSCKINDDLCSFYCFGCGAKGDVFTIYTDLYNYSFPDAVKELAQKVGIRISDENQKQYIEDNLTYKILELTTKWFEKNLLENDQCQIYLNKRSLSQDTIRDFRIGYSHNPKSSLYEYLKKNNFKDQDILKANVVKLDSKNKYRDFFYKRLIFPIASDQGKIVGFGGRVLDNSNPKYINSPESSFFKKRNILYNLNQAKNSIRKKNNILICEGYMDVISLYENNIKTAVAPLGTSLTETQLLLSWKYANKPTIMFDGDNAGLRASYKSALLALPYLSPNKFLQFIILPSEYDPDIYINKFSLRQFGELLKKPIPIVDFIFQQASSSIDLSLADNKISFDKYIDDIVDTIKDNKIKYFYRNEFKNLFFNKLKNQNKKNSKLVSELSVTSIKDKQIRSFITSYLSHVNLRDKLYKTLKNTTLLNEDLVYFLDYIQDSQYSKSSIEDILRAKLPEKISIFLKKTTESSIFRLFPYSNATYDDTDALKEIEESVKNLNTRLSNLKKINKSLSKFEDDFSSIGWEELKKIQSELHDED